MPKSLLKSVCRLSSKNKCIFIWLIVLFVLWGITKLNNRIYISQNEDFSGIQPLSTKLRDSELLEKVSVHPTDDLSVERDPCEVIHVAVVCAGYNASREVVTLIKSILFYRRSPLHFHFIVDSAAKKILSTLFRTWHLPDFTVSFYLAETLEPKVSWITNFHYSGVYGLLKLVISDALPKGINQIIVLDIDIVFLANIRELWDLFLQFGPGEAIGLVENQSDWYLGNITYNKPWPAVGRGFNTGVMLIDREKLQQLNWNNIWADVAKKGLQKLNGTILADQDIINAVIKENTGIAFKLPCLWNIQLSMRTRSFLCYENDYSNIKVLHWNAPRRLKTMLAPQFLFQYFHSFFIYDGALLRNPVGKCHKIEHKRIHYPDEDYDIDLCEVLQSDAVRLRRIHLYYFPFEYLSDKVLDVTLVTQLSIDRISMLEIIAAHWQGSISVAIFLSDFDCVKLYKYFINSEVLNFRTNIGYHLVFQDLEDTTYPVNFMRNVALEQAQSDFVFLLDVDFVPSRNLYEYILNSVLPSASPESKTAFVVPAFESLLFKNDFPETKSELLEQWDSGIITPFRLYLWPAGHNATNYTKWRNAREPYSIPWGKDYEPYLILPKKLCPNFDKRFFGFGWNKVSHIIELDALGFKFAVLPFAFVVHLPHMPSPDLSQYRTSKEYRDCVYGLKVEFIQNLADKYNIDPKKYL